MADGLDLKSILSSPLGTKTLLLRSLTYGAVSLVTVFSIIRMSFRAVRLFGIHCRDRVTVHEDVLSSRDALKVIWVDASSVAALMINNEFLPNFPMLAIPSDPVRSPVFTTEKESAITVLIKRTSPQPALCGRVNLGFGRKAVEFIVSKVHSAILSMARKVAWPIVGGQYVLG